MHSLPMCWFNILLNMYSNVHLMVVYFANNPVSSRVAHEPFHCILCINLPIFSVDDTLLNQNSFTITECEPECKFGVCNTTIGQCICPPGRTGPSCNDPGINKYVHIVFIV